MTSEKIDKILILTGTFGEGHLQVAHAIEQAMKIRSPEIESSVVDFMDWVHPNLYPLSHYVYMKSIKKFPNLYGYFYHKTYQTNTLSKAINAIFSVGMKKTLRMLLIYKPSIIVSTYPFASSVISKLKAYGLIDIPLVTVITDHTHHSYWLHAYTDHYLVGSYQVRQQLIRLGIPGRKISYTGIPIKPGFLKPQNKKELYAKYRLNPDLPTVLVMGGGDGIFASGLFRVEKLDTIPFSIQLLIVCGHNEKLRAQLEQNLKGTKHAVYIKGYVNDVTDLMAVSDCMVTKPGGVTTSEALAMELPMILYKALPGQEEDNAAFLIQAGAAVQAADEQDLLQKLIELLKHRERLAKMKNSTKNIQNKEAAFRALHVICQSKASKWLDTPKRQIPFMVRGKYSRMKKKAWLMNQPH